MIACQKGDSKTEKLLIKNGARADFQFKKNTTALMHAIKSKNIDLIKLILKKVNSRTKCNFD
jgi:ankyrin repeat protein